MTVAFEIDGQEYVALNGGSLFKFTPAVSFVINCDTQQEVDHFWEKLSEGGKTDRCGWLTDKFGLSWQVVPKVLPELIRDPRAMQAMLQMTKIDIPTLKRAAPHNRSRVSTNSVCDQEIVFVFNSSRRAPCN